MTEKAAPIEPDVDFAGGNVDADDVVSALVVQPSALSAVLAKAEIDQQIATAKQYPRSLKRVTANIVTLATMDDRASEECMYSLPRGGKPICGPSVRLAEIIASQWGNCRVAARMVDVDRENKRVEAQGMFWDLESNVGQVANVHRRIVDKYGKLYNDDMILVTGNAACSIARRNAILMGVPKAVWRRAYDMALSVIKGDVKTLAERKTKMFSAFAAFGVKPEQIFAVLGVAGDVEVTIDHLPMLVGMHQALKSGDTTVEVMFAQKRADAEFSKVKSPLSDAVTTGGVSSDTKVGDGDKKPEQKPADGKQEPQESAATSSAEPGEKPSEREPDGQSRRAPLEGDGGAGGGQEPSAKQSAAPPSSLFKE